MQAKEAMANPTRAKQDVEILCGQLREAYERLQLIQQAANIGIFEWDIQTGIITWTREAEALFGLAPGSFGGDFASWERCVYPEDLPDARRAVLESIDQQTDLDFQFRVVWPNGTIRWLYTRARTFCDSQGKPQRMVGINIDVTERKNSEEQLRLSEEKLRLFAESDVISVLLADSSGNISSANDAFLQLVGYSRAELLEGKIRWTEITPPEWLAQDQQKIAHSQETGEAVIYEKQYIHKDGHRIDVLLGYLMVGELKDQAISFALDITEQKRIARQKDEFLGVVSHELRTPVTSIKVFTQIMEKRFIKSGDAQNAELLGKMGAQIDKLTRLIGDLVDITKLDAGKLQFHLTEFNLASLIDEIIEEIQRTVPHYHIERTYTIAPLVWGDWDRIGQVLINLLSNAMKYSPSADTVRIHVMVEGAQATVGVQDFGLGIAPEQQQQLFQRFYRVEGQNLKTISGLGLGLYISAEIIRRHGGKIWVESVPDEGSTFFFTLPLQRPEPFQQEMAEV